MIPNIIHMNFGFREDFGGKPFGLIHYLAIKSALRVAPVRFICCYVPTGYWWARTLELQNTITRNQLSLVRGSYEATIPPVNADHYAHRSDIHRLCRLYHFGGIYLDCDVITLRPYESLLAHTNVIGDQYGHGLCNAVLLAEQGSAFIKEWIDSYTTFDQTQWDEHSVKLPARLAPKHDVTVLPPNAFFPFNCARQDVSDFLTHDRDLCKESFCFHLWETNGWDRLRELTVENVWDGQSEFSRLVRELLL